MKMSFEIRKKTRVKCENISWFSSFGGTYFQDKWSTDKGTLLIWP